MRLLNFIIIKLTFCLILGIIIGYFSTISINTSILLTICLILVLFALYINSKKQFIQSLWFGFLVYLVMISIGILVTNLNNQKKIYQHYTQAINTRNDSLKTITFRIREVLKPNRYYNKYIVDLLEIDSKKVIGKALLNIQKDSIQKPLKVDAICISKIRFENLTPALNPGQFDYKNYLERKYIYHQLFTTNQSFLTLETKTNTLLGCADKIRTYINNKLKFYHFKQNELTIIKALLLGQRQEINKDTYTSYTNAGAIHILAISGLHIGIILMLLNFIFKPIEHFKHGKLIKTILIVCILWGFTLIAGLSASVTRATTMFSIVVIATNLKRPTNIYNTLAISMFFILLFKPLFLFDIGFQLSYLAVFAIVNIDPFLYKLWKPKYWVTNKLWHTFTITISAQFGILPLSLYYFHQFPSLFFISNIVIIPFLGIVLGLGIAIIILAVLNFLPQFIANFYGSLIHLMNLFIDWIAKQDIFLFKDITFNLLQVLASYFLIIVFIRLVFKRNYPRLKLFLIAVLIIQCVFIYTEFDKPSHEFIVFHKSNFSLLGYVSNNKIIVANDFDSITKSRNKIITDYSIKNHIKTTEITSLSSIYQLDTKHLLVIDSLGIYKLNTLKPDYILLRDSPKINLKRLIDSIKPKQIIADGSNYKSYINYWKKTCKKQKTPFHQTEKKGAFIIKY